VHQVRPEARTELILFVQPPGFRDAKPQSGAAMPPDGIGNRALAMHAVPAHRYLLFGGIALVGCAVDLLSKRWIFDKLGMPSRTSESLWLVDGVFGFTTSLNEGALFGIGQGQGLIFSLLSIVAALGILYWLFIAKAAQDRLLTIALAAVTGGILGNLYDRLGLSGLLWEPGTLNAGQRVFAVRDWLHLKIDHVIDWPIFNIADSLLVCGAALLVWHALRSEQPTSRVEPTDGSGRPAGPTV
jgi:signal peptidase II